MYIFLIINYNSTEDVVGKNPIYYIGTLKNKNTHTQVSESKA